MSFFGKLLLEVMCSYLLLIHSVQLFYRSKFIITLNHCRCGLYLNMHCILLVPHILLFYYRTLRFLFYDNLTQNSQRSRFVLGVEFLDINVHSMFLLRFHNDRPFLLYFRPHLLPAVDSLWLLKSLCRQDWHLPLSQWCFRYLCCYSNVLIF